MNSVPLVILQHEYQRSTGNISAQLTVATLLIVIMLLLFSRDSRIKEHDKRIDACKTHDRMIAVVNRWL